MLENLTPIELNDPFYKDKIVAINVFEGIDFVGNWGATGYVRFKHKDTEGRQEFYGRNFDDVVIQIKMFLNNLK